MGTSSIVGLYRALTALRSASSRPVFDFSLTAAKINLANVPFASEWCVSLAVEPSLRRYDAKTLTGALAPQAAVVPARPARQLLRLAQGPAHPALGRRRCGINLMLGGADHHS